VVEVPIRNRSLSACGFSTFPQPSLKKEKEAKKKETAATNPLFLCLSKPALNTYKKCRSD
jgi:hypothetical protein